MIMKRYFSEISHQWILHHLHNLEKNMSFRIPRFSLKQHCKLVSILFFYFLLLQGSVAFVYT